jgi:two-component system, OmpR family, sensor histidine kinase MtrB
MSVVSTLRIDRVLSTTVRILLAPLRAVVSTLRRSIQARVVITTLVLATAVALLVAWLLLRQVTEGVLVAKRDAAITQATAGFESAQAGLDASDLVQGTGVEHELDNVIDVLSPRDQTRDDYRITLLGPFGTDSSAAAAAATRGAPDIDPRRSIPNDLLRRVLTSQGSTWRYARVYYTDGTPAHPSLVVGTSLSVATTGDEYALFYIFPLTEQQQTLAVVYRALFSAGALLVLLLGGVAWLVTRQVVTPVRMARRIAERIAAGRLEERMQVRGSDDIARLGASFNQMAQSLQREIRKLEELSRVQQRFVADVSHELRTPLTTVRMAADLLHDGRHQFDASTGRAAELLQNELDRFESLLTDLLEISRFDAGVAVLELEQVDLRLVAERVAEASASIAERAGSRLVLRLSPDPCLAEADPRRIERIVRNLVGNAIQHGRGNDVVITTATKGTAAAITVRDFGVGLKGGEELLVFGRFWRADPARARTAGGTGLGLSIALEDAALHGGRLDAWGEWGAGSQFRLTLPRIAGNAIADEPLPLIPTDGYPRTPSVPSGRRRQPRSSR